MGENALVYSKDLKNYDFGPGHPFRGSRFLEFMKVFKENRFDKYFDIIEPKPVTEEDLLLVHTKEYINRVKEGKGIDLDTPLRPELYDAARLIVGVSKLAGELVWNGDYRKVIGIGGGLHHAKRSREAGFCIFNDVAVCAKNLINKGAERILILDTDAHAGDGTSEIFYSDNKVLFIDLHQDPRTLYPGKGFIEDMGVANGWGYTINVPMPPGASDKAYEYVLNEIFEPLALKFKPDVIIRYGGSDPHFSDPLTDLGLTLDGFRSIGEKVREVSERVCNGKVIDLMVSGYKNEVLPYAWMSLMAGLTNINAEFKDSFKPDVYSGLDETKNIVSKIKEKVRFYWDV